MVEWEKAKTFQLQADIDNDIDPLPSCNISARMSSDVLVDSDEMSDLSSRGDKCMDSHYEYERLNRVQHDF